MFLFIITKKKLKALWPGHANMLPMAKIWSVRLFPHSQTAVLGLKEVLTTEPLVNRNRLFSLLAAKEITTGN